MTPCDNAQAYWWLAGELLMSGDGHKDWVAGCEFHPRAALLATSSGDGTLSRA